MKCLTCDEQLPERAAFCFVCGAPVTQRTCTGCGEELPERAAFCFICGTPVGQRAAASTVVPQPVTPTAERRLTSVLFADLVSYTTFSESRDTEDVRALLSAYFEVCSTVVRRHGGVVEKFIGDAVMAVWGVPTAFEDDAERAVRAALELVSSVAELGERLGLAELAARAGVVTGEVAANLAATDQGMVAGDPVNTASRVQAAAGSGEVWVDETTRTLTAAGITYTDMGDHLLKGKAESVRLFRAGAVVAAIGGVQRVDGLEAPLAGRDRELRQLKDLFHATEESGRPRLVVVDGQAGVGKSRLGWEFEKYIDGLSRLTKWHRGRCPSYGEGVAFWALTEAVRGRLGLVEDDAGTAVGNALDALLGTCVTDDAERAWLRPRIASLLGEETREFTQEDLFAAWTRFFDRIGGQDPMILLIDDAQHADQGLLAFVEHLVENSTIGSFVLLLARPELLDAHPQLGGRRAAILRVDPLAEPAMRELVQGLVDGLPSEVEQALVVRAEGIPLYAVETVRALIDRDLVTPREGRYVVAPGVPIDLTTVGAPQSLHALVAARLDALAPDERRVITDASVLGHTFTREGIGLLAGDIDGLDDVLARLRRKELLATENDRFSAERGQFRFVQSVVRQVAYSTLSRRDRRSRHLLVAGHLAQDSERAEDLAQVVARHLLDAADASGPEDGDAPELRSRAAELLVRAGERACGLGAFADGLRSFDTALRHLGDDHRRAQVLLSCAGAASMLDLSDRAIADSQAAVELFDASGDADGAGRAAAELANAHGTRGDYLAAIATVEPRYRQLGTTGAAPGALARLGVSMVRALQALGRWDDLAPVVDETLRLAESEGDVVALARTMNSLAAQQSVRGSRNAARALFEESLRISLENELWRQASIAQGNLGYLVANTDLGAAIGHEVASRKILSDHGYPVPNDVGEANLLSWGWAAGRPDVVEAAMRRQHELPSQHPVVGNVAAAVEQLRLSAGMEPILGDTARREPTPGGLSHHHFRSMVEAACTGDLGEAVQHGLACAREEFDINGFADDLHTLWPDAVRCALAAADSSAFDELMAYVRDAGPGELPRSMQAHAAVFEALGAQQRSGDPAVVEAGLRDGIERLTAYGALLWCARAREDLGTVLLFEGRSDDAEPLLRAARETYTDLGATSWLGRLDQLAVSR